MLWPSSSRGCLHCIACDRMETQVVNSVGVSRLAKIIELCGTESGGGVLHYVTDPDEEI